MEPTPRECGEQCQFDCYCKLVLKHEAVDYLRELKYRRDNETVFSALPQAEMDKLSTTDRYPSDSYVFSSYGCDLTDKEIGSIMGLSRSAVQKRRTRTIEVLRTKLMALMPEGGRA